LLYDHFAMMRASTHHFRSIRSAMASRHAYSVCGSSLKQSSYLTSDGGRAQRDDGEQCSVQQLCHCNNPF
jgi:hypothetical protein